MRRNMVITILFLFVLLPECVRTQQSEGTISGRIKNSKTGFESNLAAQIEEATTRQVVQTMELDSTRTFIFRHIPFGTYEVAIVWRDSIELAYRMIKVVSAVPERIEFEALMEYVSEETVVTAMRSELDKSKTTTNTIFTSSAIQELPSVSGNKKIESVLLNTPGVVPDEDGRMHFRGEDAQLQYVVDGVPITGNLSRVYSSLFNAQIIKSIDVQTGGLNAEYGVATAGVFAITTKSGFDKPFFASASSSYGTFNNREGNVQLGGNINRRTAFYAGFSGSSSERYLDPIASEKPNHSGGRAENIFGKLNFILTDNMELSVLSGYDNTQFSVPNSTNPAQDQVQNMHDYLVGTRLNIGLNSNSVLSIVGYRRFAEARITSGGLRQISSAADSAQAVRENAKFFIGGDRRNTVTGGQLEYSIRNDWFSKQDNLKIGISGEVYPLHEFFTFAVTNPNLSDTAVAGGDLRYLPYDITQGGKPFLVNQSKTGKRFSTYIQDQIHFEKWAFHVGIRADIYELLQTEKSISPRINASYAVNDRLILRGSYNRIVMQAPIENILVSSSQEAKNLVGADQGQTPTAVRSERAHVFELGALVRMNRYLDLDLAAYSKLIKNFLVKVELGNSGVIFPANLKSGFVVGGELRMRLNEWRHLSGSLNVATTVSRGLKPSDGSSPVAAGLILGEEGQNYSHPFGGESSFPTEHNQLLTAAWNLVYRPAKNVFASWGGRFDMGLPFDLVGKNGLGLSASEARAELQARGYSDKIIDLLNLSSEKAGSPDKAVKPHATFDVGAGYNLKSAISFPLTISANVLNIFNTTFLYKFESSFSGTHFGYPRMFVVKAEVEY
jgi:hypothetical protein